MPIGNVIKPQRSPGTIQLLTIGHVLIKENGKNMLYFCLPPGIFRKQLNDRLIAFQVENHEGLDENKSVAINLRKRDGQSSIDEQELLDLESEMAVKYDHRRFRFKYIATEVELLDPNAVLGNYYASFAAVRDTDKIQNAGEFDADVKGPFTISIEAPDTEPFYGTIDEVKALDRDSFHEKIVNSQSTRNNSEIILLNYVTDIDKVIEEEGQFRKPSPSEIPRKIPK